MFTAIIVGRSARATLERWHELFVPFQESGSIAFCDWNEGPGARSLEEAVPDLRNAIKGKTEWRAIVLGTGEDVLGEHRRGIDFNPFDFAGRRAVAGAIAEAPMPGQPAAHGLVRLTHMLLGLPDLGPKAFEPDLSFEDPVTRKRLTFSEFRRTNPQLTPEELEEQFSVKAALGHNRQTHYRVIHASEEEEQAHEALARQYELRQLPPADVLLIAVRPSVRSTARDVLETAWASSHTRTASRFVERNNYPASCRFLAFDLKPTGYADFDLEELSYVLTILTLATNDLPASGLQGGRLYLLSLEFDEPKLAGMLNEHLGQMIRVREYIDARLRARPPRSGVVMREVLPRIDVIVDVERIKGERLSVPLSGYGIVADRPGDDTQRWRSSIAELKSEATRFMREPDRALQQAVHETRDKETHLIAEPDVLTEIDVGELQEELLRRSGALVRRASGFRVRSQDLDELIKASDADISRTVYERLKWRSAMLAGAVIAAAWLLAILPYLIAALFDGGVNLAESLLVSVAVMATVCCTGFLCLEVMRRRFITRLRKVNQELRDFAAQVLHGAQDYSEFLSDLVTHAAGRRRLEAANRRARELLDDKVKLRRVQRRIEHRIEIEKSLIRSLNMPIQIEQQGHVISDVEQFGAAHAIKALLWDFGRGQCEFNRSGDRIDAPYGFISRLTVQDIPLSEPAMAPSSPAPEPSVPSPSSVRSED